jgi:gluconate 2-dehydrogenase gamma chain
MNRRESLKAIGLSTVSVGVLLDACKPSPEPTSEAGVPVAATPPATEPGRQDFEVERDHRLKQEKFFTEHELATITVLGDVIIPKDDHSGSASQAGVPAYIEFTAKDTPALQVPLRGGLRWLDVQCLDRYGKAFTECTSSEQVELVDEIAYPDKVKPGMEQGVAFFNRMRDLTASGFFTSEMGVRDIGYMGNHPGKWEGVPADVLRQYGFEA